MIAFCRASAAVSIIVVKAESISRPRLLIFLETSQFFADDLGVDVVVFQLAQELAVTHPRTAIAILVQPIAVYISA